MVETVFVFCFLSHEVAILSHTDEVIASKKIQGRIGLVDYADPKRAEWPLWM